MTNIKIKQNYYLPCFKKYKVLMIDESKGYTQSVQVLSEKSKIQTCPNR